MKIQRDAPIAYGQNAGPGGHLTHPGIRSRFMLGTAQLGMRYGVANRTGQPDIAAAKDLIGAAAAHGFNAFDTAEVYGESETVLGQAFAQLGLGGAVEVVTKGKLGGDVGDNLAAHVSTSLSKLGVPQLGAWLLHDEKQLADWSKEVVESAAALRRSGVVREFGVSVYSPACALRATEVLGLGAVQLPASPFDRRFLRNGTFDRVDATGARVFVRSVYLQGLGLMAPHEVPAGIAQGRDAVAALRQFCDRHDVATDHFCLHYVLQRTGSVGARVVVGLENRQQLERNVVLLSAEPLPPEWLDEWDAAWPDDIEDLVLPYRWNPNR